MNRIVPLVETPLIRVTRFEHPADESHRDPREESSGELSLSFVLKGAFTIRMGSKRYELGGGSIFTTPPGISFRTQHAEDPPTDLCLSIDYAAEFFGAGKAPPARLEPVLPLTNRTAFLKWRLERALAGNRESALYEEIGADLLSSLTETDNGSSRFAETRLSWYAERIEEARRILTASFQEDHSLASLSRAVGISPFHFARLFRSLIGVPPGRFLLETRLERAQGMLRESRSVTDTCFACGFRNLSYFVRAFRKRYGVPPSAVRRGASN
jgi:AraC-like DNA-binding protein